MAMLWLVKVSPVLFWGWKVVEVTGQHVQLALPVGRGWSQASAGLSVLRRAFPRKAFLCRWFETHWGLLRQTGLTVCHCLAWERDALL